MNEEHYLLGYLRRANETPNKDYHLRFGMEGEIKFFRDEQMADKWAARLEYFEKIDVSISPIFEAVYLFGKWKTEKDFQYALKSISKFYEMELIAYEKKWFDVLIFCIKEQISLCFKLSKDEDLKRIPERIVKYLDERREIFQTHILVRLIEQFTRLLEKTTKEEIEKVYDLVMDYVEDVTKYPFNEQLLNEAINIKRFQKDDDAVRALHRRILDLKLTEAEEKGKSSKLTRYILLERALDYCVKYVTDKELIASIKKKTSEIDFTDELVEIELPNEEKKKFEEAIKKKLEIFEKAISDYIDKSRTLHPLQILYNACNDKSLIMMKVVDTKRFTENIMKESIRHLFSETFDSGESRRRIDDLEEKKEHELHRQLEFGLRDTIWVISNIFGKLFEKNLLRLSDARNFLINCSCMNQNDLEIILDGMTRHLHGDYVSSISVLTPKIESAIYAYLKYVGADVTSYDREILSKRMLGGLIDQPEIEKNFGVDFKYFMKLFLVADDSINFRNRFSHGAVNIREFNETVSLIIIFMLLKIYAKSFKIPK
jgi:hypothetical protein